MPYIFPKRVLRQEDVLDPVELNEDFVPAAEVGSGKLNAHNIEATTSLTLETDGTSCPYYKKHYVKVENSASFGISGAHTLPRSSGNTHLVKNDMEWDLVESMTLSPTTGLSTLWITGRVQYLWLGWTTVSETSFPVSDAAYGTANKTLHGHRWSFAEVPARVQFAIRVNGAVLPHTVTGKVDPFESPVLPAKPTKQRETTGANPRFPGPAMVWEDQPTACGPECLSIKIGAAVPVQPGTHTVEIVARRVPPLKQEIYDGTGLSDTTDWEENFVAVFNRCLFALDIPTYPATGSEAFSIDVPAYEAEQVVSKESLGMKRINFVRDSLNALEPGALARGALCNQQLPSAVIDKDIATLTPSSNITVSSSYPGYGITTEASSSSGTGWYVLRPSSTATPLKTSTFSLSHQSIFVITGNVQVKNIRTDKLDSEVDRFAAFTIGYSDSSGNFFTIPVSEAYVNHYAAWHASQGAPSADEWRFDEDIDVPIFAVITNTEVLLKTNSFGASFSGSVIAGFGIYASTMNPSVTPILTFRRASLSVIQMKV